MSDPIKLLESMEAGGKTTASEVVEAMTDHVCQWPAVHSMYEKDHDTVPEEHAKQWINTLLKRGDNPRAVAISLLEDVRNEQEYENQVIDEFMCNMLNAPNGLRYMMYAMPIWSVYHNPDAKVNEVSDGNGAGLQGFSYRDDDRSIGSVIGMARMWTMDERYGGRENWNLSGDEKWEFYNLTCGEIWEELREVLWWIQSGGFFEKYLEELKLPGLPWVGLPGFPMEELTYRSFCVPKKKLEAESA